MHYRFPLSSRPCQQSMICSPRLIACQTCCRGVWPSRGFARLSSSPPLSCSPGPEPVCFPCSTPGTTGSTLSSRWWESSTEVRHHERGRGHVFKLHWTTCLYKCVRKKESLIIMMKPLRNMYAVPLTPVERVLIFQLIVWGLQVLLSKCLHRTVN